MKICRTISDFHGARKMLSGPLGLVPTMGYLHEGHLSLVHMARENNEHVAVSIFVNAIQFGQDEDLEAYPRSEGADLQVLEEKGVDLVFLPESKEMYPNGFSSLINLGNIANMLEGERRPGHFDGVTTVVAKLFNIVQPQRAYFGRKDGQQVEVIKRMTVDFNFPVEIVVGPTIREPDGLAMSSRNVYLTPEQRQAAPILFQGLREALVKWGEGEANANSLRSIVSDVIATEPIVDLDYVSLAKASTLEEIKGTVDPPAMLSVAAKVGEARLIDNVVLS